jgi:hypothetical protein
MGKTVRGPRKQRVAQQQKRRRERAAKKRTPKPLGGGR